MSNAMKVEIELCGRLADLAGPCVVLALAESGCSAVELLEHVARAVPALAEPMGTGRVRVCVNEIVVTGSARVRAGDTVALFPPVSGG